MKEMRLLLKGICCIFLFYACSGGSDDGTDTGGGGSKLEAATLVYPSKDQLCTENTINFQWQAVEAADYYELRIYTKYPDKNVYEDYVTENTSYSFELNKGEPYYWQVMSVNLEEKTESELRQFYTEHETVSNYAPFSAELVSPINQSVASGASLELKWTCTDLDGDKLVYDVSWGIDKDQLINKATSDNNSMLLNIVAGNTYYWRVDAKDSKGLKTIGQLWQFSVN